MIPASEYKSTSLPRSLVLKNISRLFFLPHLGFGKHLVQRSVMIALFFFCGVVPIICTAQSHIGLPEAIDIALKNNLSVNNEKLKTEYAKALIKSATNIPATQLNGEFGQFNSSYFDTRFSVSQSFAMPAVYSRQKQLFTKEWEAALLNVSLKEYELKKVITETFYNHIYLQEKEKLLRSIDSLYTTLLQRASLRLQKGEANVLEKTTFETQQTAIQLQLTQASQQMLVIEEVFQLLLNTDQKYVPSGSMKITEQAMYDLSSLQQHPLLKVAEQQQQVAKANTGVERSKLLPELMAGYNNMSIQGTGADDVKYSAGHRFQSGQVGIGIPIFTGAQKARIKASHINEQIAANNYNIERRSLQGAYLKYLAQYEQNKNMLDLYQNRYLKNVNTIQETANRQFINGEINYLDYVMLINQAVNIQNGYIDMLDEYNKSLISLIYLTK